MHCSKENKDKKKLNASRSKQRRGSEHHESTDILGPALLVLLFTALPVLPFVTFVVINSLQCIKKSFTADCGAVPRQRRRMIRSAEIKRKQIRTWTETPTPTTPSTWRRYSGKSRASHWWKISVLNIKSWDIYSLHLWTHTRVLMYFVLFPCKKLKLCSIQLIV